MFGGPLGWWGGWVCGRFFMRQLMTYLLVERLGVSAKVRESRGEEPVHAVRYTGLACATLDVVVPHVELEGIV